MSLERALDGSWERISQIPMRSLHPEIPLGIFGSRDWICVLSSESCLKAGGFRVLSPPFHSYCGDHKVKGRVPSFPLCQLDAEDYLGHTMSQGSNRREGRLPGERQHDLKYAFIGVLGGREKYCELRSLKLLATSSPQRGKPAYSSFPTQHPWDMQISSSASDLLANRPAGSMEGTQGMKWRRILSHRRHGIALMDSLAQTPRKMPCSPMAKTMSHL